ncbi:MAG: hypothetical protein HYU64_19090 [Armatimonadetes bacterium]|nr:hypothetical protein [Armatimonadota bacterium]
MSSIIGEMGGTQGYDPRKVKAEKGEPTHEVQSESYAGTVRKGRQQIAQEFIDELVAKNVITRTQAEEASQKLGTEGGPEGPKGQYSCSWWRQHSCSTWRQHSCSSWRQHSCGGWRQHSCSGWKW